MLERFFDEAGGMQLVIHAPFGSRINRAWGLALRKRFCRKFNFELQAAATEDEIVLSLTTRTASSSPTSPHYLHSGDACAPLLIQALLDAPMFMTRWRWDASVSLALPRFRGGKKVPPQLARMDAEDLLARRLPRSGGLRREPRRRARDSRSPAGRQTIAIASRGDGRRRAGTCCSQRHRVRRDSRRRARSDASPRRSRTRFCRRGPTRFSTTRRWKSGAPRR